MTMWVVVDSSDGVYEQDCGGDGGGDGHSDPFPKRWRGPSLFMVSMLILLAMFMAMLMGSRWWSDDVVYVGGDEDHQRLAAMVLTCIAGRGWR